MDTTLLLRAFGQNEQHPVQPDLLCFSHLRWNFVTQRPQHLLKQAGRDRRVFYWEEPIWHEPVDSGEGVESGVRLEVIEEQPSIYVMRPHLTHGADADAAQKLLLQQMMKQFGVSSFVRWYYTPMALGFTSHLNAKVTIYDCMDELSAFTNASPLLAERERQLFAMADVVFTGGLSLYEAKRPHHANVHAFPSSIEVSHFAKAKSGNLEEPEDQREITHPRAGFYGVIDERFDVDLFRRLAKLRPNVNFIILGPTVKIDPATLPQADNIHYLGSKSYQELPAYLAGWDAALLLFALNDATRFISPTKTPEYLAAGKSVVSTPIRDVARSYGDCGLVAIAETAEGFAAALDRALEPQTEAWSQAVARMLSTNSWESTWKQMQAEISRAANAHTIKVERSFLRPRHREQFDYVVVGAGFAGSVLAERLATQLNKRVLIVDKRDHIGGNAYDFRNEAGILVHKYGPHIFHTNATKVVEYLSQFTAWHPYEHRVLSSIDGKLLPVPINLDTINLLYGLNLDAEGMKRFLDERVVVPATIRTSEEVVISRVGRELYEKFFRNYTRKQWGLDPSQLDASVAGRIPVRFDRDDRYFSDSFQAMPLDGYTRMFERMLDDPRITVRMGVDYRELAGCYSNAELIYTGPIDEYFDFQFGPLPYRSLRFVHETHDRESFQPVGVVNYPNEKAYTRITEFKQLTGQRHPKTSIVYEYPQAEGDPYYPIPRPENAVLYARYRKLADASGVRFCGRLGNYKYLNMDQVVAQALSLYQRIAEENKAMLPLKTESAMMLPMAALLAGDGSTVSSL